MDTENKVENRVEEFPKPNYLLVFIILVVLTALEVGVTFTSLPRVPVLVPIAIFKAALVVLYYMHLKFDRKIFSFVFVAGLIMGVALIISLLLLIPTHL